MTAETVQAKPEGYAFPDPVDDEVRFDVIMTRPGDDPNRRFACAFTVPADDKDLLEGRAMFQFRHKLRAFLRVLREEPGFDNIDPAD